MKFKIYKTLYFLLCIPCLFIQKGFNNDIWFILNNGRYVVNNGIPYIEPFTIHQGLTYVMQQWLSAVLFWLSYFVFGDKGLLLIVIMDYIILVFFIFRLCMLLSENNYFISYVITLISTIGLYFFMVQRPYIFLFVVITCELYLLELYIKYKRIIFLFLLIFLSTILVNLEAAMWPILFVILLPYLIDSFGFKTKFIEGQGYGWKNLSLTTLAMALAGLINPYGIKAVNYLFTSYGYDEINNFIIEMHCIDVNTIVGKIMICFIFLVLIIFYIFKAKRNRLRYYLLTFGTGYMALSSTRSFSIFILCGIVPLSYLLKDLIINEKYIKSDKRTLIIRKLLIFSILITVLFVIINHSKEQYTDIKQQDLVKCADYLDKYNKSNLKIYTDYGEGGYLEFRGYKVYIDPRADVFLKSNNKKYDVMKEYVELQLGKTYYKNILDKYNFDFLIVANNDIMFNYLDYDHDYDLVYSSSYHKLYTKKYYNPN